MHTEENLKNRKQTIFNKISLSALFIILVSLTVIIISAVTIFTFVQVYGDAMKSNAVTSTEQAVVQVKNTVRNYTEDMESVMELIQTTIQENTSTDIFFEQLFMVRSDVVAVMVYDMDGNLQECWSDGQKIRDNYKKNLSYVENLPENETKNGQLVMNITKPHVESIFEYYHPWVVTFSQYMLDENDGQIQVAVDIQFEKIAEYVDDVGIGQHGYCYIADSKGEIVYHPQQQLIYYGLKEEMYKCEEDGSYVEEDAIYTVQSLDNCDWRIIGVSYVDEMITARLESTVITLAVILFLILFFVIMIAVGISVFFSRSTKMLMNEMRAFEVDADNYKFQPINGTNEIMVLSESFENMAVRIQRLVERIRQEEISLRKTELKALQAQINPHFLYNTLDAISWMCEEGETKDAKEMVNALASLFRISISRGHELIPIAKEIEHAENYLKIQNYRYQDQFTYTFDVDEACLPYLCNKITLQPIIENAIYHGLHRMVDEGIIRIDIKQENDDIIFTVEDNGIGMTQKKCREILQRESGDHVGIGIKNVNDRIKIYFGDNYGITITSEEDVGTCVTIRMPKVVENVYDEK